MSARRTSATVAASLLTVTLALTACGGDKPSGQQSSGPPPTAWSAQQATNTQDKDGDQAPAGSRKLVPAATAWSFRLPKDSAMVDPATWPDANSIYTGDQVAGVFPEAKSQEVKPCSFGTFDGGDHGMTPNNAACTWQIKTNEAQYSDAQSKMAVRLRGVGADSEVTAAWDRVRDTYRKENIAADVFYKDGTYGARRVLFRNDGLGSFVISDGKIAVWIDIQFTGFNFLSGDVQQIIPILRTQAFPLLVQDLVPKLPRSA